MLQINSSLLITILGFAASLFGLAILVQIIQEVYKFLTSSKARAYTNILVDFLGPWAAKLQNINYNLTASGPFQLRRLKPRGVLLPLNKEQLISSLEKTAPAWIRKANNSLKLEVKIQNGNAKAPSPFWNDGTSYLLGLQKGKKKKALSAGEGNYG